MRSAFVQRCPAASSFVGRCLGAAQRAEAPVAVVAGGRGQAVVHGVPQEVQVR